MFQCRMKTSIHESFYICVYQYEKMERLIVIIDWLIGARETRFQILNHLKNNISVQNVISADNSCKNTYVQILLM